MAVPAIKTARRIFEILEHFERVRTPLSLKAIAEVFDYPASSASALLKSLVMLGYIDYDRYTRTYLPTMRLASLGNWVADALLGRGSVQKLMEDVRNATGWTTSLLTQSDIHAHHIHVLDALHDDKILTRSGSLQPLITSGLGKLLLSGRDDEIVAQIVRRANFFEPEVRNRLRLADLLDDIHAIRSAGFSHGRNTITQGVSSIGMILPHHPHGRLLALGVIGPTDRLDEQRNMIVAILRDGIARLGPELAG